jgi:hypothetical protein
MPSISAIPIPTRGQVYVEANFADVPTTTNVCVEAVTGYGTDAEVRRSLHPYVSYNAAGCLALSCGMGIWYDTELPCGQPVVYCATAVNASGTVIATPAPPLLTDTFTRTVANGFGTADTGQVYATQGGVAADYSVNGSRGVISAASVNVARYATAGSGWVNADVLGTVYPTAVASGAAFSQGFTLRRDSVANSEYGARIDWGTAGTADLVIYLNNAGTVTTLSTLPIGAYTATDAWTIRFRAWGATLSASAWKTTTPEPAFPMSTLSNATLSNSDGYAYRVFRNVGNTNISLSPTVDNVTVTDVCADPVPVAACTAPVTITCDGCFWLGDPLRPCNDVHVCLCPGDGACGRDGGIGFGGIEPDTYAASSIGFVPTNSVYPIPISRNRRAAAGQLNLFTTTFAQRDALLALLAPGGVLQWRGDPAYGIGDRYLLVGDVPVAPPLRDLRVGKHVEALPFATVQAPVGPSKGVCGARIDDLCDVYATWDAVAAAGLTWADLLRGEASTTPLNLWTWNDVNANNASWNVLQASETDWTDVLDGD